MSINLREGIFAHLATHPVVMSVLGSGNDCRLHWQVIDQEIAQPSTAYSFFNEEHYLSMAQNSRPSLAEVPVMFESYGISAAQCEAADDAIYNALISVSGSLNGDGPVVQAVEFRVRNTSYDDGVKLYSTTTTYNFFVTLGG